MPQYQGVWTLEQQAQAQSNQQWVTDPNFKNTTLLLQADGTGSGSQNNTFLDGSTNNFFITRNGNTTQGSFSPFSQAPGYWSNYFNGSSTISAASNSAFNILAYDTFECWVNMAVLGTNDLIAGRDGNFWLGYNHTPISGASNKFVFSIWNGSAWQAVSSTTSPVVGTWYHIVGVKDNTTLRFYVNGVQESTSTFSGSPVTTGVFYVASNNNTENLEGYVSNLRLITGATNAVFPYSGLTTGASFTPPTSPLTAVSSTQLLTCQSNRFVDNSTNAFTLTPVSVPSVQAFGPFAPALQWTPDVVGGSGYFDGSGDYLSLPSNSAFAMGTGQFCLEAWHYPTQNSAGGIILSTRTSSINDAATFSLMQFTGTTYSMYANNNHVLTNMTPFQWNHVIVTRDSSNTLRLILNGVLGNYEASYVENMTNQVLSIGALNNGGEALYGHTTGHRITKGSIPTTYQTSSTTIGATIFTPPTQPVTLTSQGATSANVSYLSNYTNAGIYDGKMANNLETVGNAQVATSPVKYGSGSIYFDGVSPYSYLKGNANLSQSIAFGTGDFTIECWVYLTTAGSDSVIMDSRPGSNSANYFLFYLWTNGGATLPTIAWYAPTSYVVSTGTVSAGAWTHIAICRANGILRSFKNGIVQQAAADTTAYANPGAPYPYIGASYGVSSDSFKGYIDDLRVTKAARYISNFTPPQQALPRQ